MRKACDTIELAKHEVANLLGKPVKIRYNKGRNKIVYYLGEVSEIYTSVFIIKIKGELFDRLSCSYKDVLCGDIKFSLSSSNPSPESKVPLPS